MRLGDFNKTVEAVIIFEGGDKVTDDPNDKGKMTKFGISKATYPDLDIANLTKEEAIAIYKKEYWDVFKCDLLPFPVAFLLFDASVMSNPRTISKMFQICVGATADGIVGMKTIQAALSLFENNELRIANFCAEFTIRRREYYKSLKQDYYAEGWDNRAIRALSKALYYWKT